MIGNVSNKLLAPVLRNAIQKRLITVVSGPPTVHISKFEKLFLGSVMCISITLLPAWVLTHIREYRGVKTD